MAATKTSVTVELDFERETKHTFVFSTEKADAPITGLYVQKTGMPGGAPKAIKVTVEEV
jgi:hypothetical protein